MDAFFAFFTTQVATNDVEVDLPINADGGGGGSNNYCTIA
jgi:hypothetical protein